VKCRENFQAFLLKVNDLLKRSRHDAAIIGVHNSKKSWLSTAKSERKTMKMKCMEEIETGRRGARESQPQPKVAGGGWRRLAGRKNIFFGQPMRRKYRHRLKAENREKVASAR